MILIINCESIDQKAEDNINIENNYHLLKDYFQMVHFAYENIITFFISNGFSFGR